MRNVIKLLQGTPFQYKVPSEDCKMVVSDGVNKYVLEHIIQDEEGNFYITEPAEVTKDFIPAWFRYQLIDSFDMLEDGDFLIKANMLYWNSPYTYWEEVARSIELVLAGRGSEATSSVHVGDKGLNYYGYDELIRLLNFAKTKVREEKALEDEKQAFSPDDQHTIKYFWR